MIEVVVGEQDVELPARREKRRDGGLEQPGDAGAGVEQQRLGVRRKRGTHIVCRPAAGR